MKDIDLAGIYLQDVKNFLMAAERLNFSAVAREYDITPSAISKSIARLEYATNLILFNRHMGKLRLTPAGRELQRRLRDFIQIFDSAVSDAHIIQEGVVDSLAIGLPNANDLPQLALMVSDLKKAYHNINISVSVYDFGELKSRLLDGSLDVIFTSYFEKEAFENTQISWKIVNEMPLCVFIPESNPLSARDRVSVEDLRTERFIVHSPSMVPGYVKLLHDLCEPYGFTPLISKYSDNIGSFIMDLVFGDGVLIGDELLKSSFPESVRCFPLEGTRSGRIIAWDSSRENKVIRDFVKICRQKKN